MKENTDNELLSALKLAYEMLIWCSGTDDFCEDGCMHDKWLEIEPKIREAIERECNRRDPGFTLD